MVNNTPKGNVVVAAATLFSGNTFHTIAEIAKHAAYTYFQKKHFTVFKIKFCFLQLIPCTGFINKNYMQVLRILIW